MVPFVENRMLLHVCPHVIFGELALSMIQMTTRKFPFLCLILIRTSDVMWSKNKNYYDYWSSKREPAISKSSGRSKGARWLVMLHDWQVQMMSPTTMSIVYSFRSGYYDTRCHFSHLLFQWTNVNKTAEKSPVRNRRIYLFGTIFCDNDNISI